MASDEREGELTLPSEPATSQLTNEPATSQLTSEPATSQLTSKPAASQLDLLKKIKKQENITKKSKGSTEKIKEGKCSSQEGNGN